MVHFSTVPSTLAALMMVLVFLGCQRDPPGRQETAKPRVPESPGFPAQTDDSHLFPELEPPKLTSPEATFAAAKTAWESRQYGRFCRCLTPRSEERIAGGLLLAGAMTKELDAMAADLGRMTRSPGEPAVAGTDGRTATTPAMIAGLDEVFGKHGVGRRVAEGASVIECPEDAEKRMTAIAGTIEDKSAFIVDMVRVFEQFGDTSAGPSSDVIHGDLANLEVTGETAQGVIVRREAGREIRKPIGFRRVGGDWLMDLPAESREP